MARRTFLRRREASPATSVTAAAKLITLDDDKERTAENKRRERWQQDAWTFYDLLGEVREAARYYSDAISRLALYVGIRPDPQAEPVPLDPEGDEDLGVTPMDALVAVDALERLKSPQGGPAEIMRRTALQLFVPGECYLCGREDEDGERWDIYSSDELRPSDEHPGRWRLMDGPSETAATGTDLPDTATVARIWRQHPRISSWPDSPLRSALGILDELVIHTKLMRAVALSRIAGPGVLFLPNSMRKRSPVGDDADPETRGQASGNDPVVDDIIAATAAAITDPASAAGQVPVIVFVDDDLYEKIDSSKLIQWDRQIDETLARQRAELRERFAVAIDLPAELLTGKGDINHWGAWNIDREAFDQHYAPGASLVVQGLTSAYLTPYMTLAGVMDPARFVFWFDPSALLVDADEAENSRQAHDRLLISDERARRGMGFTEDDEPDDEEVQRRMEWERLRKGSSAPPDGSTAPAGPGNVDEDAPEGPETDEPEPVVGAATQSEILRGLPEDIAAIDAGLLRDLQERADAAMTRALERANNRLATLAADEGGATKETIRGLPSRGTLDIAPTLGPQVVHRLAGSQDLFAGAWSSLERDFYARTLRGGEEAIRLAEARGNLTAAQADVLRERLAQDRTQGWAVLLAALGAAAVELLFAPDVTPGKGEFDGARVTPSVIRAALVRAGGGGDAGSMLMSQTLMDLWTEAGIGFEGWVWLYGDPSARMQPFEPHRNLNYARTGIVYPKRDDPRLVNTLSFPLSATLHPDDHKGCLCLWGRAVARAVASTLPTEEAA